jgi:hypothetical protein
MNPLLSFGQLMNNYDCSLGDVDREKKSLLKKQHRQSKDMFSLTNMGERFTSCKDYKTTFEKFIKVNKNR